MKVRMLVAVYPPHKRDDVFKIPDRAGIPLDLFWRRRLADGDIEVVGAPRSPGSPKGRKSKGLPSAIKQKAEFEKPPHGGSELD